MLIGFDASRAFVTEHTGTENYSLNLLRALAKVDRKNRYRVYVRSSKLGKSVNRELSTDNFKWPANFEFVKIRPYRLWTQLGLALETWKNPVDLLFVPAHTLPILRRRSTFSSSRSALGGAAILKDCFAKFTLRLLLPRSTRDRNDIEVLAMTDKGRMKTVVTIHDLGIEYLPGYHQFPQRYYLDFASRYAARHADAVIAVSKATKHDLIRRYKTNGKKVFVVHEGVDTSFFRPSPKKEIQNVKSKYQIDGDYILFVGTVQPRKNLGMLIQAFSRLVHSSQLTVHSKKKTVNREPSTENCQLVIVGKLGWDYADILAAPKKFGVASQVKFLGHVPTADLPALYSGARVFVFPSLFEGFGLPILEALACGCPVAASDIAPHREIYKLVSNTPGVNLAGALPASQATRFDARRERGEHTPGVSKGMANGKSVDKNEAIILVKPNDMDKWTEVLYQSISQDYKCQTNVSQKGQFLAKFSWENTAKKTLEVFERVLR